MKSKDNKPETVNRRNFLKRSVLASAGLTAFGFGGASIAKAADGKSDATEITAFFPFRVIEHNSIDDILDISPDYKRMNQKNIIFSRGGWDPKYTFGDGEAQMAGLLAFRGGMVPEPLKAGGEVGWGPIEAALAHASGASLEIGTGMSSIGIRNGGPFADWEVFSHPKTKNKHQFDSPEEAAKYVKRAAKFLGAEDVGIAPFDERWIYSHWYDLPLALGLKLPYKVKKPNTKELVEAKFPFQPKSVIITIHRMDQDGLKTPGHIMDAATHLGYSRMAETGAKVASFLNSLGYKAIPAGNDTGLNVPTAIQAGMGEGSRMGLLIHPKYGPGVRIQKIYTDLEITPDKPITFGVKEFCRKCMKCADECPSKAISREVEPTPVPNNPSISSHPGVTKWYQDNEKCFAQWEKYSTGCGICVAVCPYNKPENWVHDIAKLAVGMPVGRDVARILDDSFGYGQIVPENVEKFWNNED
ncbi:reductive dehalogenase [Prolixibacteraceae bacterium JC049]|nr:reductive dehalogenase [Prolixibacteraceae bacterium JC049]